MHKTKQEIRKNIEELNNAMEQVTKLIKPIFPPIIVFIFILPFITIPLSLVVFFFSVNFALYLLAVSALIIAWCSLIYIASKDYVLSLFNRLEGQNNLLKELDKKLLKFLEILNIGYLGTFTNINECIFLP